ncbi:hypothetical protein DJ82_01290 [Halorubrum sp. Ib24]|nr:hypothetical protein [Halorubrum sp. Ib24]OYR43019.1 hypothetical protein DJ82_01290 [Halorubrum sp. Ib24]
MNETLAQTGRSPVGEPVVRATRVRGERAAEAVGFDRDPGRVAEAAETVARFGGRRTVGDEDKSWMLRGGGRVARALSAASARTSGGRARGGDGVSVAFIRKWARVHDLPQAIRRQVAGGRIAPSAAKHVARLGGTDRYLLAWATIDGGLTVREVRSIASAVNDGSDVEAAVREAGFELGSLGVRLPLDTYVDLRRRASNRNLEPGALVAEALDGYFAGASE